MEESDSIPCAPEDGLLTTWRWNRNAREQVQLRQKIKDLPGLLKHGLHLRKKSSPDTVPGPSAGVPTKSKQTCSQSFPCAGRALRNAFLSHGPYPAKDKIHLARIIRRSYVGVELVQWLMEQCVFVQCRMMAARVWQVLLELGILHSVDQRVVFEDSNTYYQFSFEECEAEGCEFRAEEEWHNGVRLLLQLVPYVQFRVVSPPEEDPEGKRDICSEILQMKALERLTSTQECNGSNRSRPRRPEGLISKTWMAVWEKTAVLHETGATLGLFRVQNELAAALARKARKSMSEEDSPDTAGSSSQEPQKPPEDKARQSGVCALRAPDDLSRLEMVQRLAKDGCRFFQSQNYRLPDRSAQTQGEGVVRVCLKERGQDVLVLQRVASDRMSPQTAGGVREDDGDRRYVVVSGTPHKILEHLLSDLRLDEHQGATESKEAETLLDDFLLTYLVFMSTHDLCQALLGHYCTKRCRGKEEGKEALYRKRKVLHLVSQWSSLYKDFLREEEHVKLFMKTLYRYVLEDVYEFPTLEKDLKEFQKLLRRRHTVDEYSPHQKSKALFQQLSLKENGVQQRGAQADIREVMCRVYVSSDSYLSMRVRSTVVAQDLLHTVAQRMDKLEEDMVLVAQTYSGEKRLLQPHDSIFSESLALPGRLIACWKDLSEVLPPLTDCAELLQRPARLLAINTWDMAVALTALDWSLFNSVHEQELVYYTFSRQASSGHTVALEQLLQRCNEVQQWVMSEVLLCASLGKRVQLLKKFIKIAAHCKAQRNLNSSFAIIMGLNTAAVSRLNQTWEKVPGKFKKLFSELELLTDPSLNHKAYRDAFRKMKSPKIPFMPLLLKDITFIHEGNKTFHDNLVNFEKLHMIADTVRLLRHCQTDQTGNDIAQSDSTDVRASVQYLHIIDNQQTLFELSHRLEPRA
ncbi:rap guanine nucleotide exchange factor 5 isoform X3 [Electrophorus electricus]|uniref:rap guanine nucleotide exchange factor 5 isoform X3 n=1 Tax=Electrophorus electricus TaxID=8005 RepID=UPI0015D020C4|nr:rap guanine nucleotide exchange factor 5 isoform X3 [Electrophorus electricus]